MIVSKEQLDAILDQYDYIWSSRIVPTAIDDDYLYGITDQRYDHSAWNTLMLRLGRRLKIEYVENSADFDAILFYINNRDCEPDTYEWKINCDERFKFRCPMNWFDLSDTEDPSVRFCKVCDKDIHILTEGMEAEDGKCYGVPSINTNGDKEILYGDVQIKVLPPLHHLLARTGMYTKNGTRGELYSLFHGVLMGSGFGSSFGGVYGFIDADDEICQFSEYIVNSFENIAVQHVFEDSGSKDLRPVVEIYIDWKKSQKSN